MPRGRTLLSVLGLVGVVLAVVAVVLGSQLLTPHGSDIAPAADAVDFSGPEVLWAQGSTVHLNETTYDVGPDVVRAMAPSRHGIFLEVARSRGLDAPTRWVLFDGSRVQELAGDPDDVKVSADGRYAGWIDRQGPRRPMGRLAVVVVVDLRTGRTVFRTTEGMGGFGDDLGDLYEELEPRFVGFDADDRPYWVNATGSGERRRSDLRSGETEAAEREAPAGSEGSTVPIGVISDPRRGTWVSHRDGRAVPEADGAADGLSWGWRSPGGRWLLGTDSTGVRPRVTDARTGEVVPLDTPGRGLYGGTFVGPDAVAFVVTQRRVESYDLSGRDRTPGSVVTCRLPAGTCTQETAGLRGALTVVLPGGSVVDDGLS